MKPIKHIAFVKLMVLRSLVDKPKHGYEIMKDLEVCGCRPSPGSVYPVLKSLENEGIILKKISGRKKVYTITAAAKKMIKTAQDPELMIIASRISKKFIDCWTDEKKRRVVKKMLLKAESELDKILKS